MSDEKKTYQVTVQHTVTESLTYSVDATDRADALAQARIRYEGGDDGLREFVSVESGPDWADADVWEEEAW